MNGTVALSVLIERKGYCNFMIVNMSKTSVPQFDVCLSIFICLCFVHIGCLHGDHQEEIKKQKQSVPHVVFLVYIFKNIYMI